MKELRFQCKIPSRIPLEKMIQFVQKIDQFDSVILIQSQHTTINGRSLLGMCILATGLVNSQVTLLISGPDAQMVFEQMKDLLFERAG
ncbi:HPr family phosphocarrier protein [Thermoactinomyces sp. CICC 10523]|jgi:phosphotransferase system HPr (HPr) family protein|uniref:HPr family phosphocarrier protein n=1 Tax=Thermoactinomyces sp. CICC 10523 TaxID=2767428 RepID=UPI0018DB023A|nr:HPr family phosphocarrier protein [Thermoactinomyces sp. CICC 10523]MBH8599120.1 HPr family phosphocarrier protein [Thermoactinomyces sp. CICC 10523]